MNPAPHSTGTGISPAWHRPGMAPHDPGTDPAWHPHRPRMAPARGATTCWPFRKRCGWVWARFVAVGAQTLMNIIVRLRNRIIGIRRQSHDRHLRYRSRLKTIAIDLRVLLYSAA